MIIFSEALRSVGVYVSESFILPHNSSTVGLSLYGRPQWLRLCVDQAVVALCFEVNVCGIWEFIAGCETVASEPENKGLDYVRMTTQLIFPLIPFPYIRVVLECYSPCLCSGALEIL